MVISLVAVVAGVVLLFAYKLLLTWAAEGVETAILRINIAIGSLFLLAVPIVFTSRTIWKVGQDAVRTQSFPPPGMKVVRDTVVVTGVKAACRGKLFQAFSVLLVVLSLAIPTCFMVSVLEAYE